MRELKNHLVGDEQYPKIVVTDEPGPGGANHEYQVEFGSPGLLRKELQQEPLQHVSFQKGPVKEAGYNGTTNEALLAIVIDRLRGFQSGEFSCRSNALALTNIEQALMWLQSRTRERVMRGVEWLNKQ